MYANNNAFIFAVIIIMLQVKIVYNLVIDSQDLAVVFVQKWHAHYRAASDYATFNFMYDNGLIYTCADKARSSPTLVQVIKCNGKLHNGI